MKVVLVNPFVSESVMRRYNDKFLMLKGNDNIELHLISSISKFLLSSLSIFVLQQCSYYLLRNPNRGVQLLNQWGFVDESAESLAKVTFSSFHTYSKSKLHL